MRTASYAPECSSSSIYTYSLPQCDGWMNQGSMSCLENCVNNILPNGCSLEHDPCQYAIENRNTEHGSFWCHHAVECSFDALDNSATVFGPLTHLTTKDTDGCSEVGIDFFGGKPVFYDQREFNIYEQGFPIKRGEFHRKKNFQASLMIKFGNQTNGAKENKPTGLLTFPDISSFMELSSRNAAPLKLNIRYRDKASDPDSSFKAAKLENYFVEDKTYHVMVHHFNQTWTLYVDGLAVYTSISDRDTVGDDTTSEMTSLFQGEIEEFKNHGVLSDSDMKLIEYRETFSNSPFVPYHKNCTPSAATFSGVLFPGDNLNVYQSTLIGGGFLETELGCQDFNECDDVSFCDTGNCKNRLGGYECESDLDDGDSSNIEISSLEVSGSKTVVQQSNQRCNQFKKDLNTAGDLLTSVYLAEGCNKFDSTVESCFEKCARNEKVDSCPEHSAPCKYALWIGDPGETGKCQFASECRYDEKSERDEKILNSGGETRITMGPIVNNYKLEKFLIRNPEKIDNLGDADINYLSRYIFKTTTEQIQTSLNEKKGRIVVKRNYE